MLIVEDIVDSGLTLEQPIAQTQGRTPNHLRSARFGQAQRQKVDLRNEYVGFKFPTGS